VGDDIVDRDRGGEGDSLGDRGLFGSVDGGSLGGDEGVSSEMCDRLGGGADEVRVERSGERVDRREREK